MKTRLTARFIISNGCEFIKFDPAYCGPRRVAKEAYRPLHYLGCGPDEAVIFTEKQADRMLNGLRWIGNNLKKIAFDTWLKCRNLTKPRQSYLLVRRFWDYSPSFPDPFYTPEPRDLLTVWSLSDD